MKNVGGADGPNVAQGPRNSAKQIGSNPITRPNPYIEGMQDVLAERDALLMRAIDRYLGEPNDFDETTTKPMKQRKR